MRNERKSSSGIRTLWLGLAMTALVLFSGGCHRALWWHRLGEDLPLFGHRNWIVIADLAYPAQSRTGIETLYTDDDHLDVVKAVLEALEDTHHVRPIVYLDAELQAVTELDARGITEYRGDLKDVLGARSFQTLPHDELIAKLDKAGEMFRILILKTKSTLPYTSVFLELDCRYWSPEAEQRLRAAIKPAK